MNSIRIIDEIYLILIFDFKGYRILWMIGLGEFFR